MKLKKFMALSMVAVMSATALFGCGKKDSEESGSDKKTETDKKTSDMSLTDMVKEGAKYEKYTCSAEYKISIESDDLFTEDEEVEAVFETLGIDPANVELVIGYEGKMNGTEEMQLALTYEVGSLSGTLTDFVLVDDMVYVNVGSIIDIVEEVGKLFNVSTEIAAVTTLLPDEDYLAISLDAVKEVYEAAMEASLEGTGMTLEDLESELSNMYSDETVEASCYIVEEVEKALKSVSSAYSDKDGIKITINNDNMADVMESVLKVLVEDVDDIMKNLQVLVGDMEELDDVKATLKELDLDEEMEGFESEMESFNDVCDFSMTMTADADDDSQKAGLNMTFNIKEDPKTKITMSFTSKNKKSDSIKISAPVSVISTEDIEALLVLMGFEDMDAFKQAMIDSFSSTGYDDIYSDDYYEDYYNDYYEDYDYTYEEDTAA